MYLVELPKHISERDANDMVFISQSAFQLCDIAIGSPTVIVTKDEVVVKTAWPTNEKSLTSVSLTKHGKYTKFIYLLSLKKLRKLIFLFYYLQPLS